MRWFSNHNDDDALGITEEEAKTPTQPETFLHLGLVAPLADKLKTTLLDTRTHGNVLCLSQCTTVMPYCDPHGWAWEPGQGPSPCMGETLSFFLALGVFFSSVLSKGMMHPVQRAAVAASSAAKIHTTQILLSLAQAVLAVTVGMLSARPPGMLCGALVLHSMGWTVAWLASALVMQRNPAFCRRLLWWWLVCALSNSILLSSLHRTSRREGHGDVPAEIACLSWLSFFANALLVVLQLAKPELDDTESVYVRVLDREGVVTSNRGWQAFWAGGDGFANRGDSHHFGQSRRASVRLLCCCNGREGQEHYERGEGGGRVWPAAAAAGSGELGAPGMLDESLLGTIGLDDRNGRNNIRSLFKSKTRRLDEESDERRGRAGCIGRIRRAFSSIAGRGDDVTVQEGDHHAETGGGGVLERESSLQQAASALSAGSGNHPRNKNVHESARFSSSSYPVASCAPRAPPQAAAPVFGVSVSRWRIVGPDGAPMAHGSPSDVVWGERLERSSDGGSLSTRTATLSASEMAAPGPRTGAEMIVGTSSDSTASADGEESGNIEYASPVAVAPVAQFELVVRASGRGEMDWWGRSATSDERASAPPGLSNAGGMAAVTAAGDWRVWRSAIDVLALYDALALRFGQDFCSRVVRPQLGTATTQRRTNAAMSGNGDGDAASSPPAAPHRLDILRDARTVGSFMRTLLGLRQFLSTAVMDFLDQPMHTGLGSSSSAVAAAVQVDAGRHAGARANDGWDEQSWDGSNDGSPSDESADERRTHNRDGSGSGGSRRPFGGSKAGPITDSSSLGHAMAGAALATDYGAWLKRLAVKLRRATPAGERFVRLRRIGPAVTGEEVVRWMVSTSAECGRNRASAARLGQDMVTHGLLRPLCAGYDSSLDAKEGALPPSSSTKGGDDGGGGEEKQQDLARSFNDAAGWLFAYAGDALRDPFAPPPPTQVAVMTGSLVDVKIPNWIETSDDEGPHVSFVVHIQVEATQEAWEAPRRYRDFTQLRKRLLRLGINIPTAAAARDGGLIGDGGRAGRRLGGLAPDLPKKTWRANKFDEDHLAARRAALEAYLEAAVKAALATPHLAGHLVMRFLDPDESEVRLLSDQNPFGSQPRSRGKKSGGDGGDGRRGGRRDSGDDGHPGTGDLGGIDREKGEKLRQDNAEAEDFDTLTDSLGGFG